MHKALGNRKRLISVQSGRALESLGHAIEYLADEYLFEFHDAPAAWRTGRIEAIQLLMTINRQIYFDCPEVPTFKQRITEFIPLFRSSHERY